MLALAPGSTAAVVNGKVAFVSDRDGYQAIWVVDADGSNPMRLTENAAGDREPTWSPDGRQVAFVRYGDGDPEIFVMDADGGNVRQLTDDVLTNVAPDWSPDGTKIAFAGYFGLDSDIFVVPVGGGAATQLTEGADLDADPAWSPDGSRIAFTRIPTGTATSDIWLMSGDGGDLVNFTASGEVDEQTPAWSPDGGTIAFGTRPGVARKPVAGGETSWFSAIAQRPAYSPTGDKLLVDAPVAGGPHDISYFPLTGPSDDPVAFVSHPANDFEADWQPAGPTVVGTTGVDLALTLTDSADPVTAGDTFSYTATVRNEGGTAADEVQLNASLAANVAYVGEAPGCTYAAPNLVCTLGSVGPGETVVRELDVQALEPGAAGMSATVTSAAGEEGDPYDNSASEPTTVEASAGPPVVNKAEDTSDGACTPAHCTLREAILAANAAAVDAPVTVGFNLVPPEPLTIRPTSALPAVQANVTIDGTTQPGYGGSPLVELDGSLAGAGVSGLLVTGTNVAIRGLSIVRFAYDGIRITGGASHVTVARNHLGLLPDGTTAAGNQGYGVLLLDAGADNVVGGDAVADGNLLSANGFSGAGVFGTGTTGTQIAGNRIGTDRTGQLDRGNAFEGVVLDGASGTTIAGNVIAGNGHNGVFVYFAPTTTIRGNTIGLAADGQTALGNGRDGIRIESGGTVVGGTGAGDRNLIAANGQNGIRLDGEATTGVVVEGNHIGAGVDPAVARGNGGAGILVGSGAHDNRIGEPPLLGPPPDGDGWRSENLIAYNNGVDPGSELAALGGIHVGATGQAISAARNRIHSNTGLAVDLAPAGPNPNDALDADAGANGLMNHPVIGSATWTGSATRIQGTFQGVPGTSVRFDWYAAPSCDSRGPRGASRWIGYSVFSVATSGVLSFDTGTGLTAPDTSAEWVTGTATDGSGNTSELGPCAKVAGAGAALTLLDTPASCVPDDLDGVTVTFEEPLETPVAERYASLGLHVLDDGLRNPEILDLGTETRSPPNALANTTGDGDPPLVLSFDEPQTAIGMFVGLGTIIEGPGTAAATLRAYDGEALLGSVETTIATAAVTSFVGVERTAGGMTRLELHIPGFDERIDDLCFTRAPLPPSGDVSNLEVTASDAGLHVGVASVPVASIPASHIPFLGGAPSAGLGTLPVSDIPVSDIPVSDIPVSDIPVSDIPVSDIGLGAAGTAALQKILLSSIPAPWATVLDGTPLEGRPLQTLTLADVFANTTARGRFAALDVGEAGLTTSLLRGTRLTSLLLGDATLSRIPVPGGYSSWCAALQAAGGSCAGLDPAADTVLGLDIQAAPVSDIPVSDIPVSDIPVSDIPVSDIPVSDIDLAATRLGDVLLRAIPNVDAVVDCTRIGCTGSNTLEDAAALNPSAIRPSATLLALQAVFGDVTLGELVLAMIRKVDFPWHRMALAGMQTFAGTGESSRYTVSFDLACAAGSPTVTLTPPPGFVPRPGTSRLTVGTAATVAIADPVRTSTGRLRWPGLALQACSTGVTHRPVEVSVEALAGFSLGERPAAASVSVSETSASAANQAPVVVAQNWEPGDDAASAPVIQPGTLVVGHVASGEDVDYFRVPIPSTRGTRTKVYLGGMVDADFDLVLLTPTAPSLLSNPVSDISLDTVPMTDPGLALNRTRDALPPETLQDIPVSDIPVSDIPVSDISANRGVEEEAAQAIALGESGYYTIAVKGYNGARSDHPYKLYVKRVPPPTLPPCPARAFPNASPGLAALPASLPAGTQTLFLVARDRLSRLYGETAVQGLLGKVATLAGRPEVAGAALEVDGDAAVRSAFAAWDASPCSIDAANAVVRNVNALVDRYRSSLPNLRYLVILGGHEAFPMALVPDLVTLSNEQDYARSLAFTTQSLTKGNALHAAALLGYVLTDDAYTAQGAIRWLNRELYLPRISGSRLVETPAEMGRQIDRYLASNGVLATGGTSTLTTGYDFLTDGSEAVAAPLDTVFSATSRLISDVWDGAALGTALAGKTLSSVNAHYSHFQVQPARYAGPADLLTTTQLLPAPADSALPGFASHVAFTMGCHAGLNVPDTLGGDGRLRDWAQAYAQNEAAVYIANTSFGYGDTAAVGLSEKLLALLAEEVPGATSFGEKLVRAKQAYFRQMGTYGVFDEKALVALTLYGLPFYRFAGGTAPPAPQPPALAPGPLPGTQIGSVDLAPPLQRHDDPRGSFWSSSDGTQFAHYRVPQPLVTRDVTVPGTLLHGVEIRALATEDVGGVDPFFATPTVDLAAHEPEPNVADAIYPANFVNVTTSHELGQTRQSLVLVAGQYRPSTPAGATGIQRLVRRLAGDLWYSTSTDTAAPVFSQVGAVRGGGTTTLFARVADGSGSVHKVSALHTVGGAWTYVTLSPAGGDLWTASLPFDAEVHVLFQAGDAAGNWGYTTAKGYLFTALPPDDGQGPHVEIESPLPGSYVLGSSVPARYSCSDPAGVARCDGTVANGTGVDTSSVGEHVFAVEAADLGGGTTTETRRYTVRYAFSGFAAPVRAGLNSARAGQTIPVKWQLRDAAGGYIRDLASVVAIGSRPIDCANRPAETIPDADDGEASGVKYDPVAEQFVYTWKTQGSWTGTCRRLVVTLNDGTLHTADFSFR